MTTITRRGIFALTGGAVGLMACRQGNNREAGEAALEPDTRAAYEGEVAYRHGVASGDPLPDRVVIWTRVTPVSGPTAPIPVSYGVFEDEAMTRPVAFGLTEATPSRGYCVKVDVAGLKPGTTYYYRFVAKAAGGQGASPLGRTLTAPAAGDTRPLRMAVVSCANYPFGRFNAYDAIARRNDVDLIVHLGDYIYEYGVDGYGGTVGQEIDRNHDPITETVTLDDYRTRHAQYKTDPALQAAHAAAPWLCTWDDHESTDNSYRTGAQNHNPEDNEGDWSDRKQAAVQAYLEWMPVRDPEPGRAREAIYRRFDFGAVATVFCLESRLTGRSEEISWFTELGGLEPAAIPPAAARTMVKVNDPQRTMLGQLQEDWLAGGLEASTASGRAWQVLANQVIMARVRPPNFARTLTDAQKAAQDAGYIRQLIPFSQLGLPWNLDAWDGFPAARERLYDVAGQAGARLVVLTGDTHTSWANTLFDSDGDLRGVEFGATSVTSPGLGSYVREVDDLGDQFVAANPEVDHYKPEGHGFLHVTFTPDRALCEYVEVSTILGEAYDTRVVARFETRRDGDDMTRLASV